ncbi:hypothetical protein [uncultured Aquimarina sp.]|uniref:hypothetical protein n=1 Tax=uncultured Aquimarina sp. TaxID=575652 RepID=UPI002622516C|nr:hypothetical protein [uncultured Aquimarina sp.]
MNITILTPEKCTKLEIELFYECVLKGKQVNKNGLKNRIIQSELLGFCYVKNKLVSVSSIKNPNNNYKKRIFEKAMMPELAKEHPYELGYAYTIDEFRGKGLNFNINKKLLSALEDSAVYATSHNKKMIESLLKLGFNPIGKVYNGDNGDEIKIYSYDVVSNNIINDGVSGFIDLNDVPN